ncbi:MAG: cyclopropane-fatty-acyl-phospholipid synthase family protein [Gemmatimonadaceae bacterium]
MASHSSITDVDQSGHDARADGALTHSRAIFQRLFGPPALRHFDIRYWDDSVEHGNAAVPPFTIVVRRRGALRRMLLPPSELSIVEAFLSGDIDVDGSIEAAATLGDAINARLKAPREAAAIVADALSLPSNDVEPDMRITRAARTVERSGKPHDRARDKASSQYHYDVGNDFYALWLDASMVYSCAYFHSETDTLEAAQTAKLELICRKLRLEPGERLLDVGCGWGALIIHAAKYHGVTALGITLSEQQATLARDRIQAAGLSDRCTVELRDYRDLPAGVAFDKIASVGMVEHVGVDHLPEYFECLHRALAPGGLLLNHGIVNDGRARTESWKDRFEAKLWRRDAFIDRYVFPDGKLAPYREIIAAGEARGFETRDAESLREHYALTLRAWLARLMRNAEVATALSDARTFRTWRLYMAASAHGFASGRLNVVQTLFAKPDDAGHSMLPLTRVDQVF